MYFGTNKKEWLIMTCRLTLLCRWRQPKTKWVYLVSSKVVLVLRKVAWADPWVIIVTTQGSAHATLRSTRMTLDYRAQKIANRDLISVSIYLHSGFKFHRLFLFILLFFMQKLTCFSSISCNFSLWLIFGIF